MNAYPAGDTQYEKVLLKSVSGDRTQGWSITREDGWSFGVPSGSPIEPRPGMTARFYGRGMGYPVRGLFLDGVRVFYRTEAEEKEHHEISMYGADAADWLARWDAGKTVWSISMGGLGPGYEQALQMAAVEVLRWLLRERPPLSEDTPDDEARAMWVRLESEVMYAPGVTRLGLSGMQWGAAKNLAAFLYGHGPRAVMADERVRDRHIQVCRDFPGGAA